MVLSASCKMPLLELSTKPVKKIGHVFLEPRITSPPPSSSEASSLSMDVPVGKLIDLEEDSSETDTSSTEVPMTVEEVELIRFEDPESESAMGNQPEAALTSPIDHLFSVHKVDLMTCDDSELGMFDETPTSRGNPSVFPKVEVMITLDDSNSGMESQFTINQTSPSCLPEVAVLTFNSSMFDAVPIRPIPSRDHSSLPLDDGEESDDEDNDEDNEEGDDDDENKEGDDDHDNKEGNDDISNGNMPGPNIEKGALAMPVHSYPNMANLRFDLTCVNCSETCGPPRVSCIYGHIICPTCYKKPKSLLTTCTAKVYMEDGITEGYCGGDVNVIDDAVKLTSYYLKFMDHVQYECGMRKWGCGTVLSGWKIDQHEKHDCPYRYIRYCGFETEGCHTSFGSIDHHLYHLVAVHKVPLEFFSEAQLLFRYDREEYFDNLTTLKPLVRAIIETRKRSIFCFLMAEDLVDPEKKVRFTRIYLANIHAHEATYHITAHLTFSTCWDDDEETIQQQESIKKEIAVLPSIKDVATMDIIKDKDAILDIENKELDKFGMVLDNKKYVQLVVKLSVKREHTDDEDDQDDEDSQLNHVSPICNGDIGPGKTHEGEEEEGEEESQDYEMTDDDSGEMSTSFGEDECELDADAKNANELEGKALELVRQAHALTISGESDYFMNTEGDDEDKLESEQERKEERIKLLNLAEALRREAQSKRRGNV